MGAPGGITEGLGGAGSGDQVPTMEEIAQAIFQEAGVLGQHCRGENQIEKMFQSLAVEVKSGFATSAINQREIQGMCECLEDKLDSLAQRTQALENTVVKLKSAAKSDMEELRGIKLTEEELQDKLESLEIESLKNAARRNNVRSLNVPEWAEREDIKRVLLHLFKSGVSSKTLRKIVPRDLPAVFCEVLCESFSPRWDKACEERSGCVPRRSHLRHDQGVFGNQTALKKCSLRCPLGTRMEKTGAGALGGGRLSRGTPGHKQASISGAFDCCGQAAEEEEPVRSVGTGEYSWGCVAHGRTPQKDRCIPGCCL
ncbi:hypothetical protein NDU88_006222 [Pleurodeles waltl]|uniref:Uncharacterized protein n=1 Tax=Pleurodeles waltl TaxID=8319 RepID=A0AAV7UKZ8_PLEWA|nr:hypothetical protein NDU88_006222 [Pleurodeles waltl]